MSQVSDISSYSFSKSDQIFLDANIWLSVYGPIAYTHRRAAIYSRAFREIKKVGPSIFINVLILSEFINRYARWEHQQSNSKNKPFKKFRKSSDFKPIAKDIANNANRIMKQCQRCCSNFMTVDIENVLREFEVGNSDFNDQIFSEICREKGFILVTDDSDFQCSSLNILTANPRLIKKPLKN